LEDSDGFQYEIVIVPVLLDRPGLAEHLKVKDTPPELDHQFKLVFEMLIQLGPFTENDGFVDDSK